MKTKTLFRKLLNNKNNKLILMLFIVCIFILYSAYSIFKPSAYKTDELVFDGETVLTMRYPSKYENFYDSYFPQKSKNIWLHGPSSSGFNCWDNNGFFQITAWSEKSGIFSRTIDEYMAKKIKWFSIYKFSSPSEQIIDGKAYYSYSRSSAEGDYISNELVGFFDTFIVIIDYEVKGYCMTEKYNLTDDISSMLNSIQHTQRI